MVFRRPAVCYYSIQSGLQVEIKISRILLIILPYYHREVIEENVVAINGLHMTIYTALCKERHQLV